MTDTVVNPILTCYRNDSIIFTGANESYLTFFIHQWIGTYLSLYETIALSPLIVYPNPADEVLIIEENGLSEVTKIILTDMIGLQSLTYAFENKISINTKDFPKGIYLVKAVKENGEMADVKQVAIQ